MVRQRRIDAAQNAIRRTRQFADEQKAYEQQQAVKKRASQTAMRDGLDDAMAQYKRAKAEEEFRAAQEETRRNVYLAEVGFEC